MQQSQVTQNRFIQHTFRPLIKSFCDDSGTYAVWKLEADSTPPDSPAMPVASRASICANEQRCSLCA